MKKIGSYLILAFFALSCNIQAQNRTTAKDQTEELGTVSWFRNYEEALDSAQKQNKAVLILFQEIPGCSTCRNYGHNVLSHPLMTEAIENLFVPLVIHNNKQGEDRTILTKYGEPSWNNPVVRIVDAKGKDVVKRLSADYSAKGLYNRMIQALNAQKKPIPEFMKLLGKELHASTDLGTQKTAYFKMYCFWTGEKQLAKAQGVVNTEPGFIGYNEVVKVTYDASVTNESELAKYAQQHSCSSIEDNGSYRISQKDESFYLKQTNYQFLPLTEVQKININSALGSRQNAEKYLSPTQLKWLKELNSARNSRQEVLFNQEFRTAWNKKGANSSLASK